VPDLPNVIHAINTCPLKLRAQVSISLGHRNRLVTQNVFENIEVATGHNLMGGERSVLNHGPENPPFLLGVREGNRALPTRGRKFSKIV
jgi:hypothetical protein